MKTVLTLLVLITPVVARAQFSAADLQKSAGSFLETKAADVNVPPAVINGVKQLAASFGFSQLDLAKLAKDALTALNGGEDIAALHAFEKLGAAKLNATQLSAFNDVKTLVDVYLLQRNFSGVPEMAGPLGSAVMAVKSGNYAGVVTQLQSLANGLKPTDDQKVLLTSLTDQYKEWAKSAEETES